MASILICSLQRKFLAQIRKLKDRLTNPIGSATSSMIQAEISNYDAKIRDLDTDLEQIKERIESRGTVESNGGVPSQDSGTRRMPHESQRDFLIRTGKITPFASMPGRSLARSGSTLQDVLLDAEEDEPEEEEAEIVEDLPVNAPMSHRNLLQPGFADSTENALVCSKSSAQARPAKRRRLGTGGFDTDGSHLSSDSFSENDKDSAFSPKTDNEENIAQGSSEGNSGEDSDEDSFALDTPASKQKHAGKKSRSLTKAALKEDLTGLDDGNEKSYTARLQSWVARRSAARRSALARRESASSMEEPFDVAFQNIHNPESLDTDDQQSLPDEEWHLPHPTQQDADFGSGYRIPGDVYPSLFDYQKTGVQWLWELYSQQVGGIIGDEMGLGKTIQVIAFLAGLHYSKKVTKPVIVVTPATVMKQWVNEFHTWWPAFRVSILHTSGSGMVDISREAQLEDELLREVNTSKRKPLTKAQKASKRIVDRVIREGHVLVTTYSGLQTYAELLIPVDWEYAVLDEGHKIRNPNTAITIFCKELHTANRIILSGTPMQNNLVELWSLFDFVFPMRLGTLVNFRQQFEIPIRQGGYANATNLQVQTAMKCAETLKETISPYLLQRFKVDVAADLPKKSEQVLFCKLTKVQREAYENFLTSDDMKAIMNRKRQVLFGIDILRKICNHPDLQEHKLLSIKPGYNYGSGAKSGKMQVVKALLELWRDTGHKTLLFAQHRIMLDILEKFVKTLEGFNFRRMDGTTPISTRQDMIDEFNNKPDVHLFLLTTKVGGLGVNLTGADRVIIYDPDWNPSTDVQARERAWRLGQKREVIIYRLMIAGTIEEKIYHRQIFKQFLTNKILRDPKQRQTFQSKDLHDLFSLGGADDSKTETGELFKGTEVQFSNGRNPSPPASDMTAIPWGGMTPPRPSRVDDSSILDVAGVASVERFHDDDKKERTNANSDATASEDRLMEGIFARSGVQSALEHDQIINGKMVVAADPRIIEKEAKKIAARAAAELKKAGEVARTVPVGTPTWTGQVGTAGRPEPQTPPSRGLGRGASRGGPASSSILSGLQSRSTALPILSSAGSSTTGGRSSGQNTPGPNGVDFMKMIRDYLGAHGGRVYTQMLIDHFNRYCTTPTRTAEFKEMLKEIAILQKGSRGRGAWVLKDEYKA